MTTRLTTADSECGAGDVIASVRDAWGVHGRSRMVERGAERGARKFLVRSQVAPILSHDTGVHRWTSLSHGCRTRPLSTPGFGIVAGQGRVGTKSHTPCKQGVEGSSPFASSQSGTELVGRGHGSKVPMFGLPGSTNERQRRVCRRASLSAAVRSGDGVQFEAQAEGVGDLQDG